MLIPTVKAKEFEKFGFKKCKGISSDLECYYLCVARVVVKTVFEWFGRGEEE